MLAPQRLGRDRVWVALPGVEFSLALNHRRIEELASIARLIEIRESSLRGPAIHSRLTRPDRQEQRMRYKIRFPSPTDMHAALATESPGLNIALRVPRRGLLAVEAPLPQHSSRADREDFASALKVLEQIYRAQIVKDILYAPEPDDVIKFAPDALPPEGSLDDVLREIKAPSAWPQSAGENIVVAIVDTGVNGLRPEFPQAHRATGVTTGAKGFSSAPQTLPPWDDPSGHGTMCACIAAASKVAGGDFTGVAPAAQLYPCRTTFYSTDLILIFDHLQAEARRGVRVVASNSWGHPTPTEPEEDPDLLRSIQEAIDAGVVVVCSAGNYHDLAGGLPDDSFPTTIWMHKCRDEVLTVAAHRLNDQRMWFYSSRGPGHCGGQQVGQRPKPDVTCPSPANGRILYGQRPRTLVDGWGTSGSCPQVAGLAALLWSAQPRLSPAEISHTIRSTAQTLGHPVHCQGAGTIDCAAALAAINPGSPGQASGDPTAGGS